MSMLDTSKRFGDSRTYTPGPGAYTAPSTFSPNRSSRSPTSPSFASGPVSRSTWVHGEVRGDVLAARKESSELGPAAIALPTTFSKASKRTDQPSSMMGTSQRFNELYKTQNVETPGPGSYVSVALSPTSPKSPRLSSSFSSPSKRVPFPIGSESPGPASVNVPSTFSPSSPSSARPTSSFGTSERFSPSSKDTPGPGAYGAYRSPTSFNVPRTNTLSSSFVASDSSRAGWISGDVRHDVVGQKKSSSDIGPAAYTVQSSFQVKSFNARVLSNTRRSTP